MPTFQEQFGDAQIGFLIRKFEEREARTRLVKRVRDIFRSRGLKIADASDYTLHSETWGNVRAFLQNAAYGIAIIDDFSVQRTGFNPNVFLEIGYMMALQKKVLILLHNRLSEQLPTDIKPFIYISFDDEKTDSEDLKNKILKWIDENIEYSNGHVRIFFNGRLNHEMVNKFKADIFSISDCCITDAGKFQTINSEEISTLNFGRKPEVVVKAEFKTQTKEMAENFRADFESGRYINAKYIQESILRIESNDAQIAIKDPDGGITSLLNTDRESVLSCPLASINGREAEIQYGSKKLILKKTKDLKKIEIVVFKGKYVPMEYFYISNYVLEGFNYAHKIHHAAIKKDWTPLPLAAHDLLFAILYRCTPDSSKLKTDPEYRKRYLEVIALHLDQVTYHIEHTVPIEMGVARNVFTFKSNAP